MKCLATVLGAMIFSATWSVAIAANVYECDMHSKGNGGFVGDKVFFELNPETATGMVFDGVIKVVYDKPLTAEVTRRNETTWRYKWTVEDYQLGNGGREDISMRATLKTDTGAVSVNGRLRGYDNNISGSGRCKVVK